MPSIREQTLRDAYALRLVAHKILFEENPDIEKAMEILSDKLKAEVNRGIELDEKADPWDIVWNMASDIIKHEAPGMATYISFTLTQAINNGVPVQDFIEAERLLGMEVTNG